jgi:hypothetical protein
VNADDIRNNIDWLVEAIRKDVQEAIKENPDISEEEAKDILQEIIFDRLIELEKEIDEGTASQREVLDD